MTKARTTVTIDEDVLRRVKIQAARTGKREGEIIEEAVRAHLGMAVWERLWARAAEEPLSDDEAMALALEAQADARKEIRKERRKAAG